MVFAALNPGGMVKDLLRRFMPAPVGQMMCRARCEGYALAVGFEMLRLRSTVSPGVYMVLSVEIEIVGIYFVYSALISSELRARL